MGDSDLFRQLMNSWGVKQHKQQDKRVEQEPEDEFSPPVKTPAEADEHIPRKEELDPDAELFLRAMNRLGVGGEDEAALLPEEDVVPESEESALFMSAVQNMDPLPGSGKESEQNLARAGLRKERLKRKEQLELGATLDLHGKRTETAVNELASFVARCYAKNVHTVMVITGKGMHSRGGVSVLRPAVEQWILKKGKRFIQSYAEAPRAYGGRGAFVLYLRKE